MNNHRTVRIDNQGTGPLPAHDWKQRMFAAIASKDLNQVATLLKDDTGIETADIKRFMAEANKLDDKQKKQDIKETLLRSCCAPLETKLALAVNELNDLRLSIEYLEAGADPRRVRLSPENPFIEREVTRVLHTIRLYPSKTPSAGETQLDAALRNRKFAEAGSLLKDKVNIDDPNAVRDLWKKAEETKQHDIIRAMIVLGIAERRELRLSENTAIKNSSIKAVMDELRRAPRPAPRRAAQHRAALRQDSDDSAVTAMTAMTTETRATSATSLSLSNEPEGQPALDKVPGKSLHEESDNASLASSMRPHHSFYGVGPKPGIRDYKLSQYLAHSASRIDTGNKVVHAGEATSPQKNVINRLDAALRKGDVNAIHNTLHRLRLVRSPLSNDNLLLIAPALGDAFRSGHHTAIDAILPVLAEVKHLPAYKTLLDSIAQDIGKMEHPHAAGAISILNELLRGVPAPATSRIIIKAAGCLRTAFAINDANAITAFTNLVDRHRSTLHKEQRTRLLDAILQQQRTSSWFDPRKSSSYKTWRDPERDANTPIYNNYRQMKLSLKH